MPESGDTRYSKKSRAAKYPRGHIRRRVGEMSGLRNDQEGVKCFSVKFRNRNIYMSDGRGRFTFNLIDIFVM